MKRFYSVEEMADATGYSAGTVRNWIAHGVLYAIQGSHRGAFRIPAGSYQKRLGELGIEPELTVELLPESPVRQMSADEFYATVIAPRLTESGFSDVPHLLSAMEHEARLYREYGDIVTDYVRYLEERESAREPVLA